MGEERQQMWEITATFQVGGWEDMTQVLAGFSAALDGLYVTIGNGSLHQPCRSVEVRLV